MPACLISTNETDGLYSRAIAYCIDNWDGAMNNVEHAIGKSCELI